jgi:predicted DNA-binding transcriptional regulator YafY
LWLAGGLNNMKPKRKKSTRRKAPRKNPLDNPDYEFPTRHQHALVGSIHAEIYRGRYPTAEFLAKKFGISLSTVYRNIRYLRDHKKYKVEIHPIHGGYYYKEPVDEHLVTSFSHGDIFVMMLAKNALRACCPEDYKMVMAGFKKLAAMLPERVRINVEELEERVSFHTRAQTIYKREVFEAYIKAAREHLQLKILYLTRGESVPKWRIVNPYDFHEIDGIWYLFAFDLTFRNEVVKFVPQRTEEVHFTGEQFERPADFSVVEYLKGSFGVYSAEGDYDVVVRFTKAKAYEAREKRWPGQQKLEELPDGGVKLHLHLTSLMEVLPWILSFEGEAWPVAPQELREKYACAMQKGLANLGVE